MEAEVVDNVLTLKIDDPVIVDLVDRVGMTGVCIATKEALTHMAEQVNDTPSVKFRAYYWLFGYGIDSITRNEPWKYMDFDTEEQVREFCAELEPLVIKWSIISGEALPDHSDGLIKPPAQDTNE